MVWPTLTRPASSRSPQRRHICALGCVDQVAAVAFADASCTRDRGVQSQPAVEPINDALQHAVVLRERVRIERRRHAASSQIRERSAHRQCEGPCPPTSVQPGSARLRSRDSGAADGRRSQMLRWRHLSPQAEARCRTFRRHCRGPVAPRRRSSGPACGASLGDLLVVEATDVVGDHVE